MRRFDRINGKMSASDGSQIRWIMRNCSRRKPHGWQAHVCFVSRMGSPITSVCFPLISLLCKTSRVKGVVRASLLPARLVTAKLHSCTTAFPFSLWTKPKQDFLRCNGVSHRELCGSDHSNNLECRWCSEQTKCFWVFSYKARLPIRINHALFLLSKKTTFNLYCNKMLFSFSDKFIFSSLSVKACGFQYCKKCTIKAVFIETVHIIIVLLTLCSSWALE